MSDAVQSTAMAAEIREGPAALARFFDRGQASLAATTRRLNEISPAVIVSEAISRARGQDPDRANRMRKVTETV